MTNLPSNDTLDECDIHFSQPKSQSTESFCQCGGAHRAPMTIVKNHETITHIAIESTQMPREKHTSNTAFVCCLNTFDNTSQSS